MYSNKCIQKKNIQLFAKDVREVKLKITLNLSSLL